jgi:hypothetical protein
LRRCLSHSPCLVSRGRSPNSTQMSLSGTRAKYARSTPEELLRQLPFIKYVVRVQRFRVAPIHFSSLSVDFERLFFSNCQPVLNLGLFGCCLLSDWNCRKKRLNDGRRRGGLRPGSLASGAPEARPYLCAVSSNSRWRYGLIALALCALGYSIASSNAETPFASSSSVATRVARICRAPSIRNSMVCGISMPFRAKIAAVRLRQFGEERDEPAAR